MVLHAELALARQLVRQACAIAQVVANRDITPDTVIKKDKSPVTTADYAVQAYILHHLREKFPEDYFVAEEESLDLGDADQKELLQKISSALEEAGSPLSAEQIQSSLASGNYAGGGSKRYWTLDPIDGTKGFLRKEQYAIALALIEDGKVVLGVLGCPNLPTKAGEQGSVYFATKGQGAFSEGLLGEASTSISAQNISDPSQAIFCESVESGHSSHDHAAQIRERLQAKTEPVRMDSQCKYASVAMGTSSIYLRLPTRAGYEEKIWDHAAGVCVIEEAGGIVSDTLGEPLDFSLGRTLANNKGVIATAAGVHEAVVEAVKTVLA